MKISELAWFCQTSTSNRPRVLDQQASLLRAAGCLGEGETLQDAIDRPAYDLEIPEQALIPVLDLCDVRYWPRDGILIATRSTSAPLSATETYTRYGPDLLVQALRGDNGTWRVKLPGGERARRRARVARVLAPVLLPLLMPIGAGYGLLKEFRSTSSGRRTRAELDDLFLKFYLMLGPGGAAVATWFGYAASGLRPGGARGLVSAVILTILGYGGMLVPVALLAMSMAMDGRTEHTQPPRRPLFYMLSRTGTTAVPILPVLFVLLWVIALLMRV